MCGIIGVHLFNTPDTVDQASRMKAIRILSVQAWLQTVERGDDAAGAALVGSDHSFSYIKGGMSVYDLLDKAKDRNVKVTWKDEFLPAWIALSEKTKSFIAHCRAKTVGDQDDNKNNHPIRIPASLIDSHFDHDFFVIHNGSITNYKELFKEEPFKSRQQGEVDSEIIAQLIADEVKDAAPTVTHLKNVSAKLKGTFAVLAVTNKYPDKVMVIRSSKPIEVAFCRRLGCMFIVSEKKFLEEALDRYNTMEFLGDTSTLTLDLEWHDMKDDTAMVIDLNKQLVGAVPKAIISGAEDVTPIPQYQANTYNWPGTQGRDDPTYHSARGNAYDDRDKYDQYGFFRHVGSREEENAPPDSICYMEANNKGEFVDAAPIVTQPETEVKEDHVEFSEVVESMNPITVDDELEDLDDEVQLSVDLVMFDVQESITKEVVNQIAEAVRTECLIGDGALYLKVAEVFEDILRTHAPVIFEDGYDYAIGKFKALCSAAQGNKEQARSEIDTNIKWGGVSLPEDVNQIRKLQDKLTRAEQIIAFAKISLAGVAAKSENTGEYLDRVINIFPVDRRDRLIKFAAQCFEDSPKAIAGKAITHGGKESTPK